MTLLTPELPPARPAASRRALWIMLGVGLAGIVIGISVVMVMLPRWLQSGGTTAVVAPAPAPADTRRIHATLFYVSDDGTELMPANREVPLGATPADQARKIVEAQIQPPPAGLTSAIPAGTSLKAVYLTPTGVAFVDLSHDIVAGHTGGSLDETLTVFAIVDALTVNLPDISAVQILIDGQEVDTIAGHVDLRHPLGKSLKWVAHGK
jgi:spore germination protein GerM